MEQNPYFDGETSDFEDDFIETDFEEQYEKEEEEKKIQSTEDGIFGIDPGKDEELPYDDDEQLPYDEPCDDDEDE